MSDRIPLGILTPKPKVSQPIQPSISTVSRETLEGLVKAGALDVVKQLIEKDSLQYRIEGEFPNAKLVDSLKGTDLYLNKFITRNNVCMQLKEDVTKLAKCPDEILITGETGTGKELIARAMIGERTGAFVAINCAGLPEHLIESELFGYIKGSFTGAEGDRQGLCAVAKDGVLFLDEIGELPISVQAKLLRAIQDRKIRRVGGKLEEDISCKFVCATHRNLRKMVIEHHFREDLYARISTFELHIPPLKERPEDIEYLILHQKGGDKFLQSLRASDKRITDIDLTFNVRSLERAVKRFNVLGKIILN